MIGGGVPRNGKIHHLQNEFGLVQRGFAAADAFFLNGVGGFAQSGRIDKNNGDAAHVGGFLNRVPGGTRDRRDDGAFVSEQLIKEARFTRVGPPDDGRAHPPTQDLPFVGGAQQFNDELAGAFAAFDEFGPGVRRDVLIGKIDMRFEVG